MSRRGEREEGGGDVSERCEGEDYAQRNGHSGEVERGRARSSAIDGEIRRGDRLGDSVGPTDIGTEREVDEESAGEELQDIMARPA